jgi:hypothetical protein
MLASKKNGGMAPFVDRQKTGLLKCRYPCSNIQNSSSLFVGYEQTTIKVFNNTKKYIKFVCGQN